MIRICIFFLGEQVDLKPVNIFWTRAGGGCGALKRRENTSGDRDLFDLIENGGKNNLSIIFSRKKQQQGTLPGKNTLSANLLTLLIFAKSDQPQN